LKAGETLVALQLAEASANSPATQSESKATPAVDQANTSQGHPSKKTKKRRRRKNKRKGRAQKKDVGDLEDAKQQEEEAVGPAGEEMKSYEATQEEVRQEARAAASRCGYGNRFEPTIATNSQHYMLHTQQHQLSFEQLCPTRCSQAEIPTHGQACCDPRGLVASAR
jgi:hypothetical protein